MQLFLILLLITVLYFVLKENKRLSDTLKLADSHSTELTTLQYKYEQSNKFINEMTEVNKRLIMELEQERTKNEEILSQKKRSETRNGQIVEQISPFLDGFKYESKQCRFLGSPLDLIVFDTNSSDPAIVFIEVKTNNSKLSKNQKIIRSLIKAGRCRFEEYRVSGKGSSTKITKNEDV